MASIILNVPDEVRLLSKRVTVDDGRIACLSSSSDSYMGLDHHQSVIDHCSSSHCWIHSLPVSGGGEILRLLYRALPQRRLGELNSKLN